MGKFRFVTDDTPPASLRKRVTLELATLVLLTPVFLYFAPRGMGLYSGVALLFLAYVALTAKYTRDRIWGPPAAPRADRLRSSMLTLSALTIPAVAVFFAWGMWEGNQVALGNLALAMGLYLPWALLQQTIFQFYFLGRLRVLLPLSPVVLAAVNGIAFGLVHLPYVPLMLLAMVAGVFWSYSYLRDRVVLPIAISHALLGTTFYYAVVGRDLLGDWWAIMNAAV
ncbi:MAG: CPBP family intramembrane metalloprotease [Gammaproteobacteria bacterium]|nr:CPBP family intramembrane metalloprotease [Gammaproteobacteria bacterium]